MPGNRHPYRDQAPAKRSLIREDLPHARLAVPAFFHTFQIPVLRAISPWNGLRTSRIHAGDNLIVNSNAPRIRRNPT